MSRPATNIPPIRPETALRLGFTSQDLARFMDKVDTAGPCWTWRGGTNGSGYGQFHKAGPDGRRQRYAHRLAYELFVGDIPEGMTIDHTCERGANGCVTPRHLELTTIAENAMRSSRGITAAKARQTECIHGHPLSGDNLYISFDRKGRQRRGCHTCRARWRAERDPETMRAAAREYRQRMRAGHACRHI